MSYALGIDVGTSYTAAAIWRSNGQQQSNTEVVPLGSRMPSVSSVLFLGADGSVVVGEAAERRSLTDPDRVVREFKRRIGDDTPLFVGGRPYAAHDLAATMVHWVVDRVTEREGGAPDRIAITHPAGWGPFKKDLVRSALSARGLDNLTFLAEPEAAAVSYAAQERVEAGTTIAVYDLGGGTFDAAVVRKTGSGSFTLLGSADGIEQLGGADFDEAVFTHVQAGLGAQLDGLDVDDPNVLSGLARLRRECTEAKEALSSDTEVSVSVLLPGVNAQVRLGRSEFEEMIRPALEDTVDSLARAIGSAGLTSADLGAVLLVGGSSRVPLVSQLVSARLGCPVVVDADPKTTIALGAALSMAPQAEPATTTTFATALLATGPDHEPLDGRGYLPDQVRNQAPDRPPRAPAQPEFAEQRESAEKSRLPRSRLTTAVLFSLIAVGLIAGAFFIPTALTSDGIPSPGEALAGTPAPGDGDPGKISAAGALQSRGGADGQTPAQGSAAPSSPSATAAAGDLGGRVTTPRPSPTTAPPPPITGNQDQQNQATNESPPTTIPEQLPTTTIEEPPPTTIPPTTTEVPPPTTIEESPPVTDSPGADPGA